MEHMRWEAITWERLTAEVADAVARRAARRPAGHDWCRVAVDGAPATDTGRLAKGLGEALRLRGCPVLEVAAAGFWRAASLRLEFGRRDPDAYYDEWYDIGALWREVFGPLEPGGTGRVLPDLRDPVTDRATRSPYTALPPGGVLLLHGPLLLGRGFPLDLSVHVSLTRAALARRTAAEEQWTLGAFGRYEDEVDPVRSADVRVRADHPHRPAWGGPPASAAADDDVARGADTRR